MSIQKGDVGTKIRVTIFDDGEAVDLSGVTTKEIILRRPDTTTATRAADFVTDGTDGKIEIVSQAGDFDIVGIYSIQAHIVNSAGDWKTDIDTFRVYKNL
jgi:hypothetical protein